MSTNTTDTSNDAASKPWTGEQHDIFEWFHSGTGNLAVEAYAGTGKTTTIIQALDYVPERNALLAAFNKRIATELQQRLTTPRATAATLHGLGFRFLRDEWGRVDVQADRRAFGLAAAVAPASAPRTLVSALARLHTKGRETNVHASPDDLVDLAYDFDLEPPPGIGWSVERLALAASDAMELATQRASVIDFADMIYLPVRCGMVRPVHDLVVIDETQDMNYPQLELASGASSGRIAIIGDRNQAIYAFRGADVGNMGRLIQTLDAKVLGLRTTFRCGHAIVQHAQQFVPDFVASDTCGAGRVDELDLEAVPATAAPDDFVLSRTNAPLAKIAMGLLKRGQRVRIAGRDIGQGLERLAIKVATGAADNMQRWHARLDSWYEMEARRLAEHAQRPSVRAKLGRLADQVETLHVIAEGLARPADVVTRLQLLFADNGRGSVVCSTVHKAKGLEANTVYVVDGSWWMGWGEGQVEERNIRYVAVTRAREHLVLCQGDPREVKFVLPESPERENEGE